MRRAYISSGIHLEKLTPEEKSIIKEALTYKFETYAGRRKVQVSKKSYKLMRNNILVLPVTRTDLIPEDFEVIDARVSVEVDIPEPSFTLRESQEQVVDEFVNTPSGVGLVNAVAGFGKSITGLGLAHALQEKTLIVTTTTAIKDMWISEIKQHFGFTPGVMTGGKYTNKDAPICVGNFQTVTKFMAETAGDFGLLIIDECHKCVASTFTDIIGTSKARYRVGLSATMNRTDGLHVMFKDYFGTDIYQPPAENVMTPEVWAISVPVQVVGWANANSQAISNLCDDPEYVDAVLTVVQILRYLGRTQLVMARRTSLLERGQEVVGGTIVTGTHNSSTAAREQVKADIYSGEEDLVWGSQNIFTEGVSWNPLDCLVMGTPISSPVVMEQAIGRICRLHGEDKQKPIVIDFILQGTYSAVQNRLKFYRNNDITVHEFQYEHFVKKFKKHLAIEP